MNHNAFIFMATQAERGEILRELLDPEDESTAIVRNVGNFTSRHGVTRQQHRYESLKSST
jgi:hypothetical protein